MKHRKVPPHRHLEGETVRTQSESADDVCDWETTKGRVTKSGCALLCLLGVWLDLFCTAFYQFITVVLFSFARFPYANAIN